ncbi:MAG: penicillin acylase family protein [Steroidobacterales bacterium]
MKFLLVIVLAVVSTAGIAGAADSEADRWHRQAQRVEIIRDQWGIAHIYGKSDADTVFGTIYAQAEDDFRRVEHNYLTGLGLRAQAEGEAAIYADLRQHLFIDPRELRALYAQSPGWLKSLMIAWADGLNLFLATHPQVKPQVITHYEPWMALSFTEGSIGGDIEDINLGKLEEFYGKHPVAALPAQEPAPGGSNGFAIAPSRSVSGHALLWINPHTSFYFRSELQMVSDQGLNVYGAVTWGQFFVYQGFNSYNGWMHTSYGGDAIDEYAETIVQKPDGPYYQYGSGLRKLKASHLSIAYKHGDGQVTRDFTVYRSHHGPIIREENGKWIAVRLLQTPVPALQQSYLRTKTKNYREFLKTQEFRTDTSNNTVYADRDGTIAYFHGNFIPRRDPRFDYTHPVDGSNPATEWRGAHALNEIISILNPKNGWLQNTNNWPFSAAGSESPLRENYPRYMWRTSENPRGVHAVELLHDIHNVTLDSLIAAGYDSHLPAFEVLLPPLLEAYDRLPATDTRKASLREPIGVLRSWDRRTGEDSVATAVAIFWGETMINRNPGAALAFDEPVFSYLIDHVTDNERLDALGAAVDRLQKDYGQWNTPWGTINRYQRLNDNITPVFDDDKPSLPIGMTSSQWGAIAAFEPAKPRRNRKLYGVSGNSFIAAIEFGPTVHAKVLTCGGESGDPGSPHFVDQADMYRRGVFRDALLTREDVLAYAALRYRPGEAGIH